MTRATGVRRARLAAAGTAAAVTATAVVGALLGAATPSPAAAASPRAAVNGSVEDRPVASLAGATTEDAATGANGEGPQLAQSPEQLALDRPPPLPARSGEGRRVVFDMSEQRVWLVHKDNSVARSYLVSGSLYDNLEAGTYEVYSRSKQAYAFDGSGSMRFMVRFTQGDNAAIGFHDIPMEDGERAQSRAELGTPRSHGCIRQWPVDAKALWRFAPLGTTVVVTD